MLLYSPHDVMGQGEVFRDMLAAVGNTELKVQAAYSLCNYNWNSIRWSKGVS